MAISTINELKTAVSNWLARDDLSPYVEDLIVVGEKYLFRHARTQEMETSFSSAMSGGTLAVPAGFLGWKWVALQGSTNRFLKTRPAGWIMEKYPLRSSTGRPFYIGRDAGYFVFGPYADSDYTVVGTYWKQPTSITSSVVDFFTNHADAYLFCALSEAEAFLKSDGRIQKWQSKRDAVIAAMNNEAKESARDSTLEMSVDFT